jgi:capsule biosynthesis phosphatase
MRERAARTMVIDVDDTILVTKNRDYSRSVPKMDVVFKLREAREKGWYIILFTARGMGRSNGDIESVREEVTREIESFCSRFCVPYDELMLGKPWAAMYVDDKGLRPDEFARIDLDTWSPTL